MILSSATEDEDTIVAGLMHDSLEDVPLYTYERLLEDCGERVAEIVKHVTEPLDANKGDDEQLPWLLRKEKYLENLRSGGVESALVSTADKIHNTESFLEDVIREGESFILRFDSSLLNKVWFHEQVLAIVIEKLGGENILVKRFMLSMEGFKKLTATVSV
jgi:(p)ppGpp synthase/HD superfamily hydrolase